MMSASPREDKLLLDLVKIGKQKEMLTGHHGLTFINILNTLGNLVA